MAAKRIDPSVRYAEDYLPDTAPAQAARHASADLALTPISPAAGRMLTVVARLLQARNVVEIGTGAGVSGLALFAGMPQDGVLTTIDLETEHQMAARDSFRLAGIPHQRYRLISGEAMTLLPKLTSAGYDLVFIDADFLEYPEYLGEALRLIRPGGAVLLNHALLAGKIANAENLDDDTMIVRDTLEAVRAMADVTAGLLPVGDGLLVVVR